MDVLIVGGTGVISTAITRELVERGHDVTLYNRGETDAAIPGGEVATIRGDRTDREDFEERIRATDGFDCAIDMVCFEPADAESDVRAFEGVADQVIFCSTIDVYHRPVERMPITEDAPHEPPVGDYGAKKSACEEVFLAAHDRGAFDATVLRPWSTYGGSSGVLHTFGSNPYYLERVRRGLPIVVHGDGTSVWGPSHREDVARAFVNAVGNEDAYGERPTTSPQRRC